jgi:hypothetical protein
MRILFVGNSHTYANALPLLVSELFNHAEGAGACEAFSVTVGGRSLEWHAAEPGSKQMIGYHDWDYVVLQQQTHPFPGADALAEAYEQLKPHLKRSGAETLLYVTWSQQGRPEDQAEIDEAFERLAAAQHLRLAPVSRAWHRALAEVPDAELYAADGGHAAPAGSYLAACVFFAVLTGRSPEGLPARITVCGDVLVDLPPGVAAALQRVAAWAVLDNG